MRVTSRSVGFLLKEMRARAEISQQEYEDLIRQLEQVTRDDRISADDLRAIIGPNEAHRLIEETRAHKQGCDELVSLLTA